MDMLATTPIMIKSIEGGTSEAVPPAGRHFVEGQRGERRVIRARDREEHASALAEVDGIHVQALDPVLAVRVRDRAAPGRDGEGQLLGLGLGLVWV